VQKKLQTLKKKMVETESTKTRPNKGGIEGVPNAHACEDGRGEPRKTIAHSLRKANSSSSCGIGARRHAQTLTGVHGSITGASRAHHGRITGASQAHHRRITGARRYTGASQALHRRPTGASQAPHRRFNCASTALQLRFNCASTALQLRFNCASTALQLRLNCA
jgi:hypothetical protein